MKPKIKVGEVWEVGSGGFPIGPCLVRVKEIGPVGIHCHVIAASNEFWGEGLNWMIEEQANRDDCWHYRKTDFIRRIREAE